MMPEDWEGHPLRKDYPVQVRKDAQTYMPLQVTEEEFRASMERDRLTRGRGPSDRDHRCRAPQQRWPRRLREAAAAHERLADGRRWRPCRRRPGDCHLADRRRHGAGRSATAAARPTRSTSSPNWSCATERTGRPGRRWRSRRTPASSPRWATTSASTRCSRARSRRSGDPVTWPRRSRPAATRPTCCRALEAARARGLVTVALTGQAAATAGHARRRST